MPYSRSGRHTDKPWSSNWGIKLDYDKEIAGDLREIAEAEQQVPLAAALTDSERERGSYVVTFADFLFKNEATRSERAALLGIAPEELVDLANYLEFEFPTDISEITPGSYKRGKALDRRIADRFGGDYVDRDAKVRLKKLRARLGRHRRNKERFG